MSEINDVGGPVDMRDIRAVREVVEREARSATLFRAEVRAFILRTESVLAEQRAHNALVARRLGLVPTPPTAPLRERIARWLPTLVTQRAALAGLTIALVLSIVGSVAALPLARSIWPLQTVPPHVHETARAEVHP